ncbi:endoribonuclease Dcr-1 [Periplaneta americana]|uniref:endoribonuclease Dcr-1 n=1 Tax=Periplaneta americana TaxID=6978 RepID=UPI0037E7F589
MAYHFNDNVYTKSFTPREYQVELLDAAKERNIIVCLGTGSGKIFIATKLIQELANAIRRPFHHGGKRTFYLVDTVAMVAQQASYIRHLTDLKVGEYTSSDAMDIWDTEDWEQEFRENQVLVMTSQICLEILQCGFLQMNYLNLIILDECHRALQDHPIRQIMKEYVTSYEQPRILGLTAPLLNSTCDPGRLEGELKRLEMVLHSTAETASDIVSVLRYCTRPKELVLECSLPTPGTLDEILELQVQNAFTFLNDHRYDPSEVYEDEFQEELKGIPDPKIDPQKIFNDFLDVLHTLGPWCADRAALVLLIQLEKLKVKTPYERHFLLLCMVSSVMVKIRAICDDIFQKYDEKERIYRFSSPKVLRLLEILRQFKPEKLPEEKPEENETKQLHEDGDLKIDTERRNSSEENINTVNGEEDIVNDAKVAVAKENEIAESDEGRSDELALNVSKNSVAEKIMSCDAEIELSTNTFSDGSIVQESESVPICPSDDKELCESEVLTEKEECVNSDTNCGMVDCLLKNNNMNDLSLHCTPDELCSPELDKINFVKDVPSVENCTDISNSSSEIGIKHCTIVPLLCEELDSNENSKVSVIESSFQYRSNDTCHCTTDCDKIQTDHIDSDVSKEISLKNNELRSVSVTPSNSRADFYPRNRGSRFARRGYQRDDVSARGNRNDVTNRQYRNMQQDDMDALCGIVFVEQRFTAKILYHLLNDLRRHDEDFSFLMTQYTVDKVADPVTDPREAEIEHRKQEEVLKRFRMRECNLLVGTSVLEEGIDIPKCNLVIHFNVPLVYRSYVQSKGRARAQDAYYILMIEEDRTQNFIYELAKYFEIEQMLLRKCANREPSEEEELEADKYTDLVEAYRPGDCPNSPSVNMATAVALVNRYCAKLPSDTFTRLTPLWNVKTVTENDHTSYICTVRLPINSPVKQDIVGPPMPTRVLARRIAALEACKVLHRAQELDDNLMPVGKESFRVHEEEETTLALEELEEMVPRDSSEPRPGTTKRRQYYYKRIADALTDCRPIPGQPAYLYHISMVLTCPLPEEQNTRGRKIYPPEDSPQGFGILTLKQIPKICPFPIFTRSGEVSVKLELSGSGVILTPDKLEKIVTFLNYTFTSVLRLQKYLMMFDPQASENSYFIVPTRKYKGGIAEVDWDFLDRIYENRDLRPHPVPEEDRVGFAFEAARYHDAVIMPWYRNQDQPQYFYVAEICGHLNPKSSFPGSEYKTFDEYYFKKYSIQIQNSKQPLLDVDHTSARLNFLTPRYVNRKGVALPTSSEETKRAKRENLEQKQILVPELCTVHPFPASLWRKAVCLPCILYRINALLLADQIRRHVASSIALGHENLNPGFEWPPLDFGWSLADVLKKSKENAKNAEQNKDKPGDDKNEKNDNEKKPELEGIEEKKEEDSEMKEKSANEILTEEEKKLRGDWMEIGTWSNDMANHEPMSFSELSDADDFDMNVALPSNLTMVDEDAELAGLHSGGSDWGTGIQARKGRERVRYGSPSSWMGTGGYFGGLEQDLEGYETDDTCSEPGNEFDQSDSSDLQGSSGLRIEFKSENVAEAIEDEREVQKRERRHATIRQNSDSSGNDDEIPWNWEKDNDDDLHKLTEKYIEQFHEATEKNRKFIEDSGTLIRSNQPLVIIRKGSQHSPQNQNIMSAPDVNKPEPKPPVMDTKKASQELILPCNQFTSLQITTVKFNLKLSPERADNNDSGLSVDGSSEESEVEGVDSVHSEASDSDDTWRENDQDEDIINKFSFDAQPDLQGHPGPSPSVILQALTMSNANDGINLERLETIGDSFLKYAITTYLYCTYDNIHEGKLSHLRSKQVSNLNLYRLGRRKVFGESMIATKFEPHDNWLPPCYYVPRELEQALIEAGVPASHWNQADLPALRDLSRDEICELVRERSEKLRKTSTGEDGITEEVLITSGSYSNIENLPCFIPYNLITQHSIPDKSVADCVEALIGAYLIACGPRGALLFMAWLGICVLPKEEVSFSVSYPDIDHSRPVGSLLPLKSNSEENSVTTVKWKQVRYGTLKAPRSPLLRNVSNPEAELKKLLDGYEVFERRIGYKFRDRSYLLQSLTHASYSPNRLTDCYQRLEFLGDAVLDYLITRHLYEDSRQHSPGALTDLRSALVNNTIFASLAVRYGFHKYFRHLSPGLNEVVDRFVRIQEENGHTISEEYYLIEEEECEEAEDVEVPKALGDVFESVAGAIFLDSGMSLDAVWRVYYRMMKTEIEQFSTNVPKSPIRELLELEPETAKFGKPEKLADGRRVRVTVEVFGKGTFKGIGRNYRIAKCTAAKCALKQLKKKGLLSRKM